MSNSWIEVKTAQDEKRCELVISGSAFSSRIEKNGLDPGIFKLTSLNFLEITKTCLKELPPFIAHLENLTKMVISQNELTALPSEIGSLKKLKLLDASHNALTALPSEISELTGLLSLNVRSNSLTSLPPLGNLLKLVSLNICHNQFTDLPESLFDAKLIHFTDLVANNNAITRVPPEIENLTSLKVLDLGENEIAEMCGELGGCGKLKELNLKGNKLKDKRLLKLVDQCHAKQVMEYIRSHCPKGDSDNSKQAKSKKKAKQNKKAEVEEVTEKLDELKILHVADETLKVVCTPAVADVRPYIVCCKVDDVDLTDPILMKSFITMQTKLHDTICEKRTAATIATHDFSKLQGNLFYDAKKPQSIKILPLNRSKELTATELYVQLNNEADAVRKEKKKNTYSGIHKYLYLLKDKPLYPCLSDSSGLVISFPPLTNAEGSKISKETKSILIEVTGNNLSTCKKVMDALLVEMLKLGVGKKSTNEEDEENEVQRNFLTVQQIQIVDEEGQLKSVYPSRTDVQAEGITVQRT